MLDSKQENGKEYRMRGIYRPQKSIRVWEVRKRQGGVLYFFGRCHGLLEAIRLNQAAGDYLAMMKDVNSDTQR